MDARATLLLVEDDPTTTALLRDVLTDAGYRVLVAATPTLGCAILAAFRVGLVLTAGFRGGDDPWAPLAPLVAQAGSTPVILCSAANPALYADHAARGFAALLPRPFDLDALVALVAALLPRGGRADAVTDISAAYREGCGHVPQQVVQVERLPDIVPHPAPGELGRVLPRRQEEDRHVGGWFAVAQQVVDGETVQAGQVDVQQHQIDLDLGDEGQRVRAVAHGGRLVGGDVVRDRRDDLGDGGGILHQDRALFHGRPPCIPPTRGRVLAPPPAIGLAGEQMHSWCHGSPVMALLH